MTRTKMIGAVRGRPDCGHEKLVECPLTVEDWAAVLVAAMDEGDDD